MKNLLYLFLVLALTTCKSDQKEDKQEEQKIVIPENETKSASPKDASIARGKTIYSQICVVCHLSTGKGITGTFPPLDGSTWLTEKREASIRAVKYGLQGDIQVNGKEFSNAMTPMGLSDEEVADVLNYVMNSWSNKNDDLVTPQEVSNIKPEE